MRRNPRISHIRRKLRPILGRAARLVFLGFFGVHGTRLPSDPRGLRRLSAHVACCLSSTVPDWNREYNPSGLPGNALWFGSHDPALARDEAFALWTDVGIGSSVVIELVRQKTVADADPSEALPDPPIIFNPRADEFDILIVRRQNVLAARIASIHNDPLRRPTKPGLDLLDCGARYS